MVMSEQTKTTRPAEVSGIASLALLEQTGSSMMPPRPCQSRWRSPLQSSGIAHVAVSEQVESLGTVFYCHFRAGWEFRDGLFGCNMADWELENDLWSQKK